MSRLGNLFNSPFVLLLIGSGVFAGIGGLYKSHEDSVKELDVRRSALVRLLVEYQHRVSVIGAADSGLPQFTKKLDRHDHTAAAAFDRQALDSGRREHDAIEGNGSYVPTAPEFKSLNIESLAAQIDETAGIPPIQSSTLHMLGILEAEPRVVWVFIRGLHQSLVEFGVRRQMMLTTGELPLPRGRTLTAQQEVRLGIVTPTEAQLTKLQAESDRLHNEVQAISP